MNAQRPLKRFRLKFHSGQEISFDANFEALLSLPDPNARIAGLDAFPIRRKPATFTVTAEIVSPIKFSKSRRK